MFDDTSDILPILIAIILLIVIWGLYVNFSKKKKSILVNEVRIDAKNNEQKYDNNDDTTEDSVIMSSEQQTKGLDLIKIHRAKIVRQPDPIPDEMSGQFNTGIIDMTPWVQYDPQLQGTYETRVNSNIYDPLGVPSVSLGPLGPPGAPGFGPPEGAAGGFRA